MFLPQRAQRARRRDCEIFSILCALCVLCGESLLFDAGCYAADVVPIDGERFEAKLVSIDRGRAAFRPAGKEEQPADREVTLESLVRWGHPVALRPQTLVLLNDGSRLVAAAEWSGGAPLKFAGNSLIVLS